MAHQMNWFLMTFLIGSTAKGFRYSLFAGGSGEVKAGLRGGDNWSGTQLDGKKRLNELGWKMNKWFEAEAINHHFETIDQRFDILHESFDPMMK